MKLPKGFTVASMHAGIKKKGYDLGLISCPDGASAVGFFTKNVNPSYSVTVSKKHIGNRICAVLTNSGNANCFTNARDLKKTEDLCKTVAKNLGIPSRNVLIASTGIIGKPMPFRMVEKKIRALCGKPADNFPLFAQSIRTTDTFSKISSKTVPGKTGQVRVVGCAKGAGMIQPDMATMLAFVLTDADVSRPLLKKIARRAVEKSFNSISVDGCMSTNDCIFFLSSGKASLGKGPGALGRLEKAIEDVCVDLAKMIVSDGEGATKTAQIVISGAHSQTQAQTAFRAIASSVLFRSALFGENPNWGRIVAALGAVGIAVKENKFKVTAGSLKERNVTIKVHLGLGAYTWQGWCSDITPRYVHINAGYS
jgi:glutamate N-acetyltransferase/amino-acid N-acetyltransferase